MQYSRQTEQLHMKHTAVALGKFDGIHRGHQLLLDQILQQQRLGKIGVVYTFDFSALMSKSVVKRSLFTSDEKQYYLNELGIDVMVESLFTVEFSKMTPFQFIRDILVEQLDAEIIVVGNDFHFGFQRKGDINTLKSYEKQFGYEVIVIDKLHENKKVISSSIIRELISHGRICTANQLLGHPYMLGGVVVCGQQFGRTIGVPTANIEADVKKLLPPNGVYHTRVMLAGIQYNAVTNIGIRPTIEDDNHITIETYIIDYNGDLYDEYLMICFIEYIRPEHKFASIQKLQEQLEMDIQTVKKKYLTTLE